MQRKTAKMRNEENECFCEVCHADASVWVCGTHVFIAKPSFMRNYHCYCSALSSFVLIFASRSWLNSSINASLYGRVVNGGSAPSLVNQFEQAAIGSAKKKQTKGRVQKNQKPTHVQRQTVCEWARKGGIQCAPKYCIQYKSNKYLTREIWIKHYYFDRHI